MQGTGTPSNTTGVHSTPALAAHGVDVVLAVDHPLRNRTTAVRARLRPRPPARRHDRDRADRKFVCISHAHLPARSMVEGNVCLIAPARHAISSRESSWPRLEADAPARAQPHLSVRSPYRGPPPFAQP
eukprot:scaffold261179_cov24-Tisochrysis_lutea.AAC.4